MQLPAVVTDMLQILHQSVFPLNRLWAWVFISSLPSLLDCLLCLCWIMHLEIWNKWVTVVEFLNSWWCTIEVNRNPLLTSMSARSNPKRGCCCWNNCICFVSVVSVFHKYIYIFFYIFIYLYTHSCVVNGFSVT